MRPDRTFGRNFFVIAVLHIVAVAVIYLFSLWQGKPPVDQVMWLEGGSIGGGSPGANEAAPEPQKVADTEPKPEPPPPEPKPEPLPPPPPKSAPSELVTPQATPEVTTPKPSTPKPVTPKQATPRPETPTPTPVTPKPTTPKPTPKHTPKPKPATPKATPKATPSDEEGESATPKPKASPAAKPKGTPAEAKAGDGASNTPGATPGKSGGNGAGTGNGKGPGKAGGGSGASEFGWYFSMIHDHFHSRWDQPTSIARNGQDIVTTLKIRIGKDGTILNREIVHSSGDSTMDESVMTAADRVQQIDPLPAGLGTGDSFEINIAFKLDQN